MSKTSEMLRSISNNEEVKSINDDPTDKKRPIFGISLSGMKNKDSRTRIKKIIDEKA